MPIRMGRLSAAARSKPYYVKPKPGIYKAKKTARSRMTNLNRHFSSMDCAVIFARELMLINVPIEIYKKGRLFWSGNKISILKEVAKSEMRG